MGAVINASEAFRYSASNNSSYIVHSVGSTYPYILLKISDVKKPKDIIYAAIHCDDAQKLQLDLGDKIRVEMLTQFVHANTNGMPYVVLSSIKKLEGVVITDRRGDFISSINFDDPNHPVNTVWNRSEIPLCP